MTRQEILRIAKPILFNTDMVRAILEGRKTVTRRVVKYKYDNTEMKMRTDKYGTRLIEIQRDVEGETYGKNPGGSTWRKLLPYIEKEPFFKRGDILYVRETWSEWTDGYLYKAWNGPFAQPGESSVMKWHPSIHMPKEAARIFLKVTNVRVERLQDIDVQGVLREGCKVDWECVGINGCGIECKDCYKKFEELWNSTIKKSDLAKYGWDANPWVWVVEFERLEVEV